jgi:hypothetical protein
VAVRWPISPPATVQHAQTRDVQFRVMQYLFADIRGAVCDFCQQTFCPSCCFVLLVISFVSAGDTKRKHYRNSSLRRMEEHDLHVTAAFGTL